MGGRHMVLHLCMVFSVVRGTVVMPSPHPTILTNTPSTNPTAYPTTREPTRGPTSLPLSLPTPIPTPEPTPIPTPEPSRLPTRPPSSLPTLMPTLEPSRLPTMSPSALPTTEHPSRLPTMSPSALPTLTPTLEPSRLPTMSPSALPSLNPTDQPTKLPTLSPSSLPSLNPTDQPTSLPTLSPSSLPSLNPTAAPSSPPTLMPSSLPSLNPTSAPSSPPTLMPSSLPSMNPSSQPSLAPTLAPSALPTLAPTGQPSLGPTIFPTALPTLSPTALPTLEPTGMPTYAPTAAPSLFPSNVPTLVPTHVPTSVPIPQPTFEPTASAAPTTPSTVRLGVIIEMSASDRPSDENSLNLKQLFAAQLSLTITDIQGWELTYAFGSTRSRERRSLLSNLIWTAAFDIVTIADEVSDLEDTVVATLVSNSFTSAIASGLSGMTLAVDTASVNVIKFTRPPTAVPIPVPTILPTSVPSPFPSPVPTLSHWPTPIPTLVPSPVPTSVPSPVPSSWPTFEPTSYFDHYNNLYMTWGVGFVFLWALGAVVVYLAHEEQKSMQGKALGSLFLVLSVMDFWSDVLWCRIRYKRHDEKKQTYTGDGFSTQQIPERDPDEMVFMTASTAVIGLTTVLTLMAITRLVYRQSKKQYMNVNKLPDKATIVIIVMAVMDPEFVALLPWNEHAYKLRNSPFPMKGALQVTFYRSFQNLAQIFLQSWFTAVYHPENRTDGFTSVSIALSCVMLSISVYRWTWLKQADESIGTTATWDDIFHDHDIFSFLNDARVAANKNIVVDEEPRDLVAELRSLLPARLSALLDDAPSMANFSSLLSRRAGAKIALVAEGEEFSGDSGAPEATDAEKSTAIAPNYPANVGTIVFAEDEEALPDTYGTTEAEHVDDSTAAAAAAAREASVDKEPIPASTGIVVAEGESLNASGKLENPTETAKENAELPLSAEPPQQKGLGLISKDTCFGLHIALLRRGYSQVGDVLEHFNDDDVDRIMGVLKLDEWTLKEWIMTSELDWKTLSITHDINQAEFDAAYKAQLLTNRKRRGRRALKMLVEHIHSVRAQYGQPLLENLRLANEIFDDNDTAGLDDEEGISFDVPSTAKVGEIIHVNFDGQTADVSVTDEMIAAGKGKLVVKGLKKSTAKSAPETNLLQLAFRQIYTLVYEVRSAAVDCSEIESLLFLCRSSPLIDEEVARALEKRIAGAGISKICHLRFADEELMKELLSDDFSGEKEKGAGNSAKSESSSSDDTSEPKSADKKGSENEANDDSETVVIDIPSDINSGTRITVTTESGQIRQVKVEPEMIEAGSVSVLVPWSGEKKKTNEYTVKLTGLGTILEVVRRTIKEMETKAKQMLNGDLDKSKKKKETFSLSQKKVSLSPEEIAATLLDEMQRDEENAILDKKKLKPHLYSKKFDSQRRKDVNRRRTQAERNKEAGGEPLSTETVEWLLSPSPCWGRFEEEVAVWQSKDVANKDAANDEQQGSEVESTRKGESADEQVDEQVDDPDPTPSASTGPVEGGAVEGSSGVAGPQLNAVDATEAATAAAAAGAGIAEEVLAKWQVALGKLSEMGFDDTEAAIGLLEQHATLENFEEKLEVIAGLLSGAPPSTS